MSIGYACLTVGERNTDFKSCVMKNATEERLQELIAYNLNSLIHIIDYNVKNRIRLFRISSDLIPFGSSNVNHLPWWDIFSPQLDVIGTKIRESGMRVSMHPGQYTVLNSPTVEVVNRAIEDLNYHARVLDSLGVNAEHKIVLHIGGVYQDKKAASERFMSIYEMLPEEVKRRLVIENDDKSYKIEDVLEIGRRMEIPVIFDNLHNAVNPSETGYSDSEWIVLCGKTWKDYDGVQKIHYSQQDIQKRAGSHSNTIQIREFMKFYEELSDRDIDIMLEVKDKNLSAVKCINCTGMERNIKVLEQEWSRYKYSILERSQGAYLALRKLLKNKSDYPASEFYRIIEEAMKQEIQIGTAINAAQHVWGYFKNRATEKEKEKFLKIIGEYETGRADIRPIKNWLWRLTEKYEEPYLLNSYYFDF